MSKPSRVACGYPKELHDERGIFVVDLAQFVKLGNCFVESVLGQVTGFSMLVHDLIQAHGVVEGEAQADGVGGLEIRRRTLAGDFESTLVVLNSFKIISFIVNAFGQVAVVVGGHLLVEHLSLVVFFIFGDEGVLQQIQDRFANGVKFVLELLLVDSNEFGLVARRGLLLVENSPSSAAGTDDVFVRNRKKISFLHGQTLTSSDQSQFFHKMRHVIVPLRIEMIIW